MKAIRRHPALARFAGRLLLCAGCALSAAACAGQEQDGRVTASGTIEATEVRVPARVPGTIVRLDAEEGRRVAPGETLAVVDHASLDVQLRQAMAGVELAEAQLQLLRNGARSEDVRQADEALNQAGANLKAAREDLERMRALVATGSVTEKQRSDAQARHDVALAQYNQVEQALRKARNPARPEELRAAAARLVQAQAAAELLAQRRAEAYVVAPSGGTVTRKLVEEGEMVGQGAPVVVLSRLDRVYLNLYVSEEELARVRLGAPAEVTVDGYPERRFRGRVVYTSPEAEFTPKNVQTKEERIKLVFRVKVAVDNPEGVLKPGLPADAVLAP